MNFSGAHISKKIKIARRKSRMSERPEQMGSLCARLAGTESFLKDIGAIFSNIIISY